MAGDPAGAGVGGGSAEGCDEGGGSEEAGCRAGGAWRRLGGGQSLRRGHQGLSPIADAAAEESGGAGAAGALSRQDGRRRRSQADARRARRRSGTNRACWRCRSSAILALQSGDFAGAVDAYDKLLAKAPANVDARMALLDALKGLKRRRRRKSAHARHGAGAKAQDRAQGRRRPAASRRGGSSRCSSTAMLPRIFTRGQAPFWPMGNPQRRRRCARARPSAAHADLEEAQYLLGLTYVNPDIGRRRRPEGLAARAPVKEAQLALGVDAYESGDLDEANKRLKGAARWTAVSSGPTTSSGWSARAGRDGQAKRRGKAARIDPKSELGHWASTKLQVLTGDVHAFAEGQVIDSVVGNRHRPGDRRAGAGAWAG